MSDSTTPNPRRRQRNDNVSPPPNLLLNRGSSFNFFSQSSVERANIELAGKFRVTEVIGKGGFGTVLKGTSNESGDYVAIKQIDKFMIDAIQLPGIMKEAEILKRLNHPNIVKIYSFLETPNTLYFVLEYVEHGSLAGLLKKFGVFPEHLIASYTEQILRGLKYLHEESIIHRDIKGDNILITKDGKVKLADFGTAKLEDAEKKTQTVVGTPYWMAPEVIEMSACGPTSDIWSLGCTVIELLTGAPPYFELGPMSALFNIVEDRHPPLPENLSEDLRSFLKVCFKKDPRQRPTAAELVEHKWLKQFAKAEGDIEAVSGTLRLHNQQGVKKSVLSIFPQDGPSTSGTPPASEKKRKGSVQPQTALAGNGSSAPSSAASSPSSGTSKKTNAAKMSVGASDATKQPTSAAAVGSVSSATAALVQPSSPNSGGTVSSKKISSKTSKAKNAAQDHLKATSEMQAQYEVQKKERDRLAKERQRMEEQLLLLRKETLTAHAQLNGLSLLLKSVGLESKSAKQSVKIVRSMQETIGKDTYIKLAYGHMSRQSKSIRPAAILDDEASRERRNSF
jgi:serine/threonine protein kinase